MTDVGSTDKQEEASDARAEDDLPQKILEKYDSDLQVQIIKGYRILQVIAYYLKDDTFFEKPANEERGGKLYYDVIKNPMWLNEIKRKIFDAEYNSLVEIIKDMRLVFENCYYFWGPKTVISEQCIKMERLMEKHLLSLPRDLRITCSLEETHGKNTDKIVTKIWNRYRNKGKGCSNLMLRTWRKRRLAEDERYRNKSDLANYCDCKKQIHKWEKEVLRLEEHSNSTFNVVQLPQIGQFFHLIADVLKKKPYCQIEIERMFLIPSYSQSFREMLTVLLIDEFREEPASFDDLMMKLKQLLIDWYSVYEDENHDDVKASRIIGIEPEFFRIVGETNPLLTTSYENLTYRQKVVTVKSLCDRFVHENSNVKEAITTADEKIFAFETIGRDKYGYGYLFFNTFLDFRLYKQLIEDDDASSNNKFYQGDFSNENETLKKFFPKSCTNFEMVADSVEGLRCLIDELIYSDVETSKKDGKSTNYEVIESLRHLENRIIENEDLFTERTNRARMKLFDEWKSLDPRFQHFLDDEENASNECHENAESERALSSDADDSNHDSAISKSTPSKSVDNTDEDETRFSSNTFDEIKEEPTVDEKHERLTNERNVDSFFIKTEIKDEFPPSETSNVSSRRRRSSVASYNVFDKKLFFSDESDSESPEEIYTEGDDSDDDWNVPKKKSKKAPKNKLAKQLKLNAEDASRRRKQSRKKSEPEPEPEPEPECAASAENEASTVEEMEHTTIKTEEELDIVDSITTTNCEEYDSGTLKLEDKCKPEQKIKVVDLARLQNSQDVSKTSKDESMECAPMPRIVSQGTLRVPSQNASTLDGVPLMGSPVISSSTPDAGNGFSAGHPTTFAIVAQPQVISNAYIITTNQSPYQATSAPQYQMQPFASAPYSNHAIPSVTSAVSAQNSRMPRIVNTTGAYANNATPNNKMVFVNQKQPAPVRLSPMASQQATRTPSTFVNKSTRFRPNPTPTFNRQISPALSAKNNYPRNIVASKLGRNITVIPKVINKINERGNSFKEIEGVIGIHSNNGTWQYVVNLANGSHVPLTNEQVQKLREGNNGALPTKLKIPVPMDVAEKIEPCVVIDD